MSIDFRSKIKNPMPKEVLRSNAPAAPAAVSSATPPADPLAEMEARLRAMALDEPLIKAALDAERKKLAAGGTVSKPTEKPAEKPPAPATPAKTAAPAAPVKAEAAAEDPNEALRRAYEEDHGGSADAAVPEEAALPLAERAPSAPVEAADAEVDHDENTSVPVVQNHYSSASGGAITGPIDRSDFKTPQLKIVQGSGPLAKKFNQGTLIFMDLTVFDPPPPDKAGPPINFIPVTLQKYYREVIKRDPVTNQAPVGPDGQPIQPRQAATAEEVKKLGGTIDFTVGADGKRLNPTWGPAARVGLLIERPEGCTHPGFTFEVDVGGKLRYFAAAIMFVNGGQYRGLCRPLIDATNFILCEGTGTSRRIILEKRIWKMQVVKEQSGQNWVFNPKVEMLPEATPQPLKEFAVSLRGA